ncbi:DsbA-like thioredoxin domain protein [Grimontia indica]|uniref:DsbA-like thioredoxin domain protein n=1 Tax=Grimontia indica TaxID=1056512 RepID=R1IX02_9GAMM|nr:DsbA family protein [Grimontia indica]EOD81942.1 DsbA-like thioredoxin domain protein [Grimontia indica]
MTVQVNFYSDLLCFWGWVGQHYNDKIMHLWDNSHVQWQHHYLALYANVPERMNSIGVGERGYMKYAEITERLMAKFDGLDVHPDLWRKVRPSSSLMPHQALKAVQFVAGNDVAVELEHALREAFFRDARDISHYGVLKDVLEECHLATPDIMEHFLTGKALADVYGDIKHAEEDKIPGSPAWIFDSGRYRFFGQVDIDVLAFAINNLARE